MNKKLLTQRFLKQKKNFRRLLLGNSLLFLGILPNVVTGPPGLYRASYFHPVVDWIIFLLCLLAIVVVTIMINDTVHKLVFLNRQEKFLDARVREQTKKKAKGDKKEVTETPLSDKSNQNRLFVLQVKSFFFWNEKWFNVCFEDGLLYFSNEFIDKGKAEIQKKNYEEWS